MGYPYQTNVQNENAIVFGSCKVEIGADLGSLEDFGIAKSVVFQEEITKSILGADNAGELHKMRKQRVMVTGSFVEFDPAKWNSMRGGIDTYSTVAGTLVSGATQDFIAGKWGYNDPVVIEHQNCDKSPLTINSVTGSVDGALVADTDYFVGQNEDGDTVVTVIDSATVTTETQTITVDYDYTPCASKTLKSGGKLDISTRVVRLTNTDDQGKILRLTLYKTYIDSPINIPFQPDEGEDPAEMPFQMIGIPDPTRSAGDQVFEIYNEQAA